MGSTRSTGMSSRTQAAPARTSATGGRLPGKAPQASQKDDAAFENLKAEVCLKESDVMTCCKIVFVGVSILDVEQGNI